VLAHFPAPPRASTHWDFFFVNLFARMEALKIPLLNVIKHASRRDTRCRFFF